MYSKDSFYPLIHNVLIVVLRHFDTVLCIFLISNLQETSDWNVFLSCVTYLLPRLPTIF